ncbi:hypothetical protein PF008_g13675 [Phytophthora fragariae]|uniref:PiggyBac transposable element-derived protein domain-containing protein n=1 Tax=Phytophthora fragariae TaxID=53985 RepID=A0A6G0RJD1_9STRA|nr:hypothetical protein PF008_g13675 [Phytophthora fragariae]
MPRGQKRCSPPVAASEAKRRRMPSRLANTTKTPTPREDSVLFKEIWRSLHRNGWTSKPPALRSLDTSYRYVKPGCNPDGDEGTDFFRGEQALVAYYQMQGDQLIQTDGDTVRVLPGNDLSITSRSSLAPSVGEQERKNAGTDDVIIDKESDEGDTAVGQRSSGVFDAEKGVDLHGDCASSCSADEERDDGFPRCHTTTSAPVGGSSPVPRGFEVYVDSLVAYTPAKEKWLMTKKLAPTFGQVGTAYIVGRVCRRFIEKKLVLYEIRWLDSLFQKHTHSDKIGVLQRGIENYRVLSRSTSKPTWSALNTTPDGEDLPSDALLEDLVEVEGYTELTQTRHYRQVCAKCRP